MQSTYSYTRLPDESDAEWKARILCLFADLNPYHPHPELLKHTNDLQNAPLKAYTPERYASVWGLCADYTYEANCLAPIPPFQLYDREGCALCHSGDADHMPIEAYYLNLLDALHDARQYAGKTVETVVIRNVFDNPIRHIEPL